jgi:hypothetical protein
VQVPFSPFVFFCYFLSFAQWRVSLVGKRFWSIVPWQIVVRIIIIIFLVSNDFASMAKCEYGVEWG